MAKAEQACKVPINCTGWGIHGIWWVVSTVNFANYYNIYRPTQLGSEGPNYCNKSATFSWKAIDVSNQFGFTLVLYHILYITGFGW